MDWQATDLTERATAVECVSNPCGYQGLDHARVVYAGADGHVHELYLGANSPWHDADLTKLAQGVDNVGNPRGYQGFDHARVVYPGADGHVHELFLGANSPWHDADLTKLATAAPSAGSPMGHIATMRERLLGARVVYRGPDGHVHELSLRADPDAEWEHDDLTTRTRSQPAVGDPFGYHAPGHARVVYRGADGHVHELSLRADPGAEWEHDDLTTRTRSQPAVGDPFGYTTVWSTGRHARVVYRGTDDHVHELFLRADSDPEWEYLDLTTRTRSQPAAGDPAAFISYVGRPTARVVYLGSDGHVHELSLVGSPPLR